jgi:integrase
MAIEDLAVYAVRSHPELSYSDNGVVTFTPPLPLSILQAFHGHSVDINIDGLRFSVTIGDEIRLPLACSSFREAKDLAMAVSIQIMAAMLQSRQAGPEPIGEMPYRPETRSLGSADRTVSPVKLSVVETSPVMERQTFRADRPDPPKANPVTFARLFQEWMRYHLDTGGAPTTPPYWKVLVERFVVFLGHDRPGDVTAQDIRAYRDHLIRNGRRLRTARHSDFAALRALFHFGVENELVPANPTLGVKFKSERLASAETMSAFSMEEARAILKAADGQTIPSRRWIPWLTALTGSRVAAIANLRKQDVVQIDGIWCLKISRQAGPIKTAASERIVPIHPDILKRGFLAFVERTGRQRLFVRDRTDEHLGSASNPAAGEQASPYNPARSTIRRVTEWIHSLGLDIGRAAKKDPNHAWRHWFKEQAFAAGIPEKITDAIVGHAQATTSRRYGSVSIAAMAQELQKITSPIKR